MPDTTALDSSYVDEAIERDIVNSLSFIEGAIRSAEILKSDGFKSQIVIIDSEQDSTKLIETYSYENTEAILYENLKEKLEESGIRCEPMPVENIWKIINEVAKDEIDAFTTLLKKLGLTSIKFL